MPDEHGYELELTWTGNTGDGTRSYRGYSRDHLISAEGPGTLAGTADVAFRGVPGRWNPEQLFLASIAQCHLLTYLWLCVRAGVVVTAYRDAPTGVLRTRPDGSGRFESVLLRPQVTVSAESDPETARALHDRVGEYCFIARSVDVPIHHEVGIVVER
ncbi:OsmC family protein [Propionicicella superfundia]|uniref:OsmC family protein n=1 Tax=Propionicicella superfundia TaxID=348582 RepID=UPI00041D438E|nr:OsmC family protein [Propionicicella superfundia]